MIKKVKFKIYNIFRSNQQFLNQQGFSLVEILVALGIVTLIFFATNFTPNNGVQILTEVVGKLRQTIRFCENESSLTGKIVRMRFQFGEEATIYTLEAGPEGEFVLPSFDRFQNEDAMSLSDYSERDSILKNVESQFNRISEFQDDPIKFPDQVTVLGVASDTRNTLIDSGEASIYCYPTGDKDSALIILSSQTEVATLSISPFQKETQLNFSKLSEGEALSEEDMLERQQQVATNLYAKWLTE